MQENYSSEKEHRATEELLQETGGNAPQEEITENATKPISIHLPKQVSGRDSAHYFTHNGNHRVAVTLPPHFKVTDLDGVEQDASYATFFCSKAQLQSFADSDPYYRAIQPATNKEGEPWVVKLEKRSGEWENPEADTKEGRGKWIECEKTYISCTSQELEKASIFCREQRKEFAVARSQEQEVESPQSAPRLGDTQRQSTDASRELNSGRSTPSLEQEK